MYICIPIEADRGLKSEICLHFATAPLFMVVQPETLAYRVCTNKETPINEKVSLLKSEEVSSAIVGGIDLIALHELRDAGISVLTTQEDIVEDIVTAFKEGTTNPVTLGDGCKSHHSGRGFNGPGGCCGPQGHGGCRGFG